VAKPLPTSAARSSSHAARASAQRERILDAAEKCFIDSGFHAAGMARIAQTADISAGLIYRYFDSKAAIVEAIIARQLESETNRVIDQIACTDDMCTAMLDVFDRWRRGNDPKMNTGLLLDLMAECTRDPKIARLVRNNDRAVEERLAHAVERLAQLRGGKLTSAEARGRAILLQCLTEGLACRAARDPGLQRRAFKPALEQIVGVLFA
jgi:AcrR family transcriptional regulator